MKIITFDIEDWFHLLDNPLTNQVETWAQFESRIDYGVGIILDIMDRYNLKGTFFCLGWIAEKYPYIIKKINDCGHHIGTHSYYHQLVYSQTENEFRSDLSSSIKILSDLTGKEINAYRAPGFSIKKHTLWAFDILFEEGILYDCSIFPANRAHGGIPQFKSDQPCKIITKRGYEIIEFPINTASLFGNKFVFSGGGYFRLLPISVLRYLFNKKDYVMTYFHPRDFDYEQPMAPGLNLIRKFKSYYGLKQSSEKLSDILKRYNFQNVSNSISLLSKNMETIYL